MCVLRNLFLSLAFVCLAGCGATTDLEKSLSGVPLLDNPSGTLHYAKSNLATDAGHISASSSSSVALLEQPGSGTFLNTGALYTTGATTTGRDGIMLNLVGVPVAQAAKAVLGDILKVNYTISDKVTGSVTLQTTTPMDRSAVADALDAALRINGAIIIRNGETYAIVPSAETLKLSKAVALGGNRGGLGLQTEVIPLEHVSALEMKKILDSAQGQDHVLRVDQARNLIIVSGTKYELGNINDMVRLFDVDWMKGRSVGVFPITSGDPEAIATDLEKVMGLDGGGPLADMVRVIPNQRLNSILVIAARPALLTQASTWLKRLERVAQSAEPQLFIYLVKNRPTSELADVLRKLIRSDGAPAGETPNPGDVAPKLEPSTEKVSQQSPHGFSSQGLGTDQANSFSKTQLFADASTSTPSASDPTSDQASAQTPGASSRDLSKLASVKVTTDEAKHALLIEAFPVQYERIHRILERLDTVSTQVMLEAVIAEVSLNDELKFGLKWYFESKPSSFTFSDAANGAIASAFPGFSYFFTASSMKMALDALSSITKVNVVSAPSLMVVDNRKAVLQIGDEVPTITQSAQSVVNPDAPIVNSVEMKDTGVILAVTPRVNESGSVVLDIEQEVSNVAKTTSSGIDSPTIQQRRVKTTVVVGDGQVVALGGLIQQRDEVDKTQVPILGNIPIVGSAFGTKDNTITRTELVIFIRPQVARDQTAAQQITDEYRSRINLEPLLSTAGSNHYRRDANRMFR